MNRRRATGFTLIELLIVIAVIGILAGMLIPAVALIRETARKSACGSNQRQIVMEMIAYSTETKYWPGTLDASQVPVPTSGAAALQLMFGRIDDDVQAYVCPSDPAAATKRKALQDLPMIVPGTPTWTPGMTSYAYDLDIPLLAKPVRVVMADDKDSSHLTNHNKFIKSTIAAFADGHIATLTRNSTNQYPNPDADDADIYCPLTGGTYTPSDPSHVTRADVRR
jgi:prepilin-type N-terminal cleavage/methylation domain-containing protein